MAKPLTMRSVSCDRGKADRQVDISAKMTPQTWQRDWLELGQRTFDIQSSCCPNRNTFRTNLPCRNFTDGFRIGDLIPNDNDHLVLRV
ncbi:MAG: hypothetical protein ACXVKA_12485 [Acidimicrobiia bacterium]